MKPSEMTEGKYYRATLEGRASMSYVSGSYVGRAYLSDSNGWVITEIDPPLPVIPEDAEYIRVTFKPNDTDYYPWGPHRTVVLKWGELKYSAGRGWMDPEVKTWSSQFATVHPHSNPKKSDIFWDKIEKLEVVVPKVSTVYITKGVVK